MTAKIEFRNAADIERIMILERALREARSMLKIVSVDDDEECGDIRESWMKQLKRVDEILGDEVPA